MSIPYLKREIFKTSRLLEFCSEKELVNQTGHAVDQWPLVVLKALVDNAIDGCEETGIPPVIKVIVRDGMITVSDNGPGIIRNPAEGLPQELRLAGIKGVYIAAPDRAPCVPRPATPKKSLVQIELVPPSSTAIIVGCLCCRLLPAAR